MAADPAVEQIALVAQREAARVHAGGHLAQPTAGTGIAYRQVEVDRGLLHSREARGIDPQRACVGDVGRVKIQGGPIGHGLRGGAGDERQEEQRDRSDRLTASHYGNTATVVCVSWVTGTARPCTAR